MFKSAMFMAFGAVLTIAPPVHAQSRPNTLSMSCAQAQALVISRGVIVLGTGPQAYERYVSGPKFCNREEEARPAWAPTADNAQCYIGRRCVEVDFPED